MVSVGDGGVWQDRVGGLDTGGSSGLVRGTAGYMRPRNESLVCLFTYQKTRGQFKRDIDT